jgi:hypothetical protein
MLLHFKNLLKKKWVGLNSKMVTASALERAPVGLADVAALPGQPGLDLAVERGGHQRFAALLLGGIDDQPAVRREARALVGRVSVMDCDVAAGKLPSRAA